MPRWSDPTPKTRRWVIICYQEMLGKARERAEEAFESIVATGLPTMLIDVSSVGAWCVAAYGRMDDFSKIRYPEPDDRGSGYARVRGLLGLFGRIVRIGNFRTNDLEKAMDEFIRMTDEEIRIPLNY